MERIKRQNKPTTQRTLRFDKLDRDGQMTIAHNRYSHTYKLGDAVYTMAREEDKYNILDTYRKVLDGLENNANYQLLVVNRRISPEVMSKYYYDLQQDDYDTYRKEYNQLMKKRFDENAKAFELGKYITVAMDGFDDEHARRNFHDTTTQMISKFRQIDVTLEHLDGANRLALFSELLRDTKEFPYDYDDIEASGIGEKSFIAPNSIRIQKDYLEVDDNFVKVKYIRHFPKLMSDKLIYDLSKLSFEFTLVVNAGVYDVDKLMMEIEQTETDAGINIIRASKRAVEKGVFLPEQFIGSEVDKEKMASTSTWKEAVTNHDEKVFKGWIAVCLKAESLQTLKEQERLIDSVGKSLGVRFENMPYYQEEALNSILPIGECFVDLRQKVTRRMTSTNITTQVPFTQSDIVSKSDKALYYGQSQLSHNAITLNRKKDLLTGSGVIVGVSGSGKSFAVKLNEIIPNLLRYPDDRIIIVDPDDEYGDIGKPFNGQSIDISIGSNTCINILDLPTFEKLEGKDARDPIGEKSNFLATLFSSVLQGLTDAQVGIIDRVTQLTYQRYEKPTMKEWHSILLEQEEDVAQDLALDIEVYTVGTQSIFSSHTNVDLTNQLVIFNLKNLSGKLKPFALLVIQNFIWNQVVENKGKNTTWLYFDELQLYLRDREQAKFFMELYSRVRKYGAIPTGITQNIETIATFEEGRKLLSNSEFMMILKQKLPDIKVLKEVITITEEQAKYVLTPKAEGTGLIYAGGMVVPFENPIPSHFELYKIIETSA